MNEYTYILVFDLKKMEIFAERFFEDIESLQCCAKRKKKS